VLKIAVLLSGGVDSSVALTLLKAAGHDVTAFYLQIWFQEDFRNYWDQCPWEDDLRVARGVCDALDVPLRVVPLTDAYWDLVVSKSIDEIAKGRTPNPDIWCNSRVKFGAFREHLAKAHPAEFDRVASGHYAATDRNSGDDGIVRLVLSGDLHKDQTYFLAHLSQQQLRHLCFPVGGLPKEALRGVARDAGLPNADRKDSQGICFLGKVKFSEFVAEHLGEREGAIVELETGDLLGTHRGFWFHTIGQRSGLGLSGGPWYVAAKDVDGNVVYATREYYALEKRRNAFEVEAFSWVSGTPPPRCRDGYAFGIKAASAKSAKSGGTHAVPSRTVPSSGSAPSGREADDVAKEAATRDPTAVPGSSAATATAASSRLFVKTRHGENRYGCTLRFSEDGASGSVVIERDDQGLAAGQFAVFYDGETCLGCGVIAATKADEALIARDARHRTVIQGGVRRIAEDRKRAAKRGA
jgi:tRNA-specific 2-thiouridylase